MSLRVFEKARAFSTASIVAPTVATRVHLLLLNYLAPTAAVSAESVNFGRLLKLIISRARSFGNSKRIIVSFYCSCHHSSGAAGRSAGRLVAWSAVRRTRHNGSMARAGAPTTIILI